MGEAHSVILVTNLPYPPCLPCLPTPSGSRAELE
jgi:hypothetical protein